MSAPHITLDNLPSFSQKLSDFVRVWRSYNKNNFECFLRHGVLICLNVSLCWIGFWRFDPMYLPCPQCIRTIAINLAAVSPHEPACFLIENFCLSRQTAQRRETPHPSLERPEISILTMRTSRVILRWIKNYKRDFVRDNKTVIQKSWAYCYVQKLLYWHLWQRVDLDVVLRTVDLLIV